MTTLTRVSTVCLAIPGEVTDVFEDSGLLMGMVDFGGVRKRVCLEHVPDVVRGEYVLVHVGFALTRVDEAEAQRIFQILAESEELDELHDDEPASHADEDGEPEG